MSTPRPSPISSLDAQKALPPGYEYLQKKMKELAGIDLSAYKTRQMLRRLTGYLTRNGMDNFFVLARQIDKDPDALEHLKDFLTINVSEFFRNPERFIDLEKRIVPDLLTRREELLIWSAGCSIGAEPYSLSILLEELDPKGNHEILGTDLDAKALHVAKAGVYREELLKEVTKERLRFFHSQGDGTWKVDSTITKRVQWRVHDLLKDPYPVGVDLILCRNVVIYFTDEAKGHVFRQFAAALVAGGYLMVGSTESIFNAGEYGLRLVSPFVYQKEGG